MREKERVREQWEREVDRKSIRLGLERTLEKNRKEALEKSIQAVQEIKKTIMYVLNKNFPLLSDLIYLLLVVMRNQQKCRQKMSKEKPRNEKRG